MTVDEFDLLDQQQRTRPLKGNPGEEMTTCECPYLPEKYHTTHYGATDPATIQEYNPWCPEHGHLKEEKK